MASWAQFRKATGPARVAHLDGESLIRHLKPIVLGQDPLERERLDQALWGSGTA
jgi:hypothetical protein